MDCQCGQTLKDTIEEVGNPESLDPRRMCDPETNQDLPRTSPAENQVDG